MKETGFVENSEKGSFNNVVPSVIENNMAQKKPYLYFTPLCNDSGRKLLPKEMQNDFEPIFRIASFFGITFCSSNGSKDETAVKNYGFKKYYDILFNIIAVLSFAISVSFVHNFSVKKAMTITYLLKYIAGLFIRFNMILGSYKIPKVIDILSQLYGEVAVSVYRSLKSKIYLQCLFFTLLNGILFSVVVLSVFCDGKVQNRQYLSFFGYNLTTIGGISVVHIVIASYLTNNIISIFTVSMCVLSCCNVHVILRRVIKSYGEALIESLQNNATKESFTDNFIIFRRIIYGVHAADNALSFITLFTYVATISCFFHTLSSVLTSTDFFGRPIFAAEIIIVFAFAFAIFFSLTYNAAEVTTAGDKLKQRVFCMSEIILKKNLATDAVLSFMILTDNIKCSSTSLTGWGMFPITRGFVLTIAGVMITYGVLLFQFD
ncbi:uncharacterized protein LOC118180920 [Stegodyphus dumicola]|uniref:uncharacterized protein LOC118180920 n=1 Tax=Stegodyphus dumicola TaxID=202533 RepID=UPI0015AF0B6B|nr:uncharacterized protein LOC118180920 [Stegodyphus dumicola]